MADAIGGQQRQRQFPRDFHGRLIARFFFAAEMPLQFDVDIFAAEEFAELLHALQSPARIPPCAERMRQRAFFASREANQAGGVLGDFFGAKRGLRLFARAISCA